MRTGLIDAQNERVEVVEGLAEGDVLLTGVAQGVTPGTQVKVIDRSQAAGRRGQQRRQPAPKSYAASPEGARRRRRGRPPGGHPGLPASVHRSG